MDNRIRLLPGGTQPTSTVSPFAVIEAEKWVAETRAGNRQSPAGSQARELQVTGTAEVSYPADRASVRLSVGNSKATVNEVTSSVSRRLEYILQAVRQHGVREDDITVRKFLHRDEEVYHMNAEVTVTFSDFEKMEQSCSVLLEKLDRSVSVGLPRFFHSAECLNHIRESFCRVHVSLRWRMPSRRPAESASYWGKAWGRPPWCERRRCESGRPRMRVRRKMGVEEGGAKRPPPPRPHLFPAYQAPPPSRGCLSTSGCVIEIGKNTKYWRIKNLFVWIDLYRWGSNNFRCHIGRD